MTRQEDARSAALRDSGAEVVVGNLLAEPWEATVRQLGLSAHVASHLITMAAMHRGNRYDRRTDDVEKLTGSPPMSIVDFVRMHAAELAPEGAAA